jgi:hypothetical protein
LLYYIEHIYYSIQDKQEYTHFNEVSGGGVHVILILGGNVMSKKQTIITIVIVALAFTVGFFVGDSSAIHRVNKQISAKN